MSLESTLFNYITTYLQSHSNTHIIIAYSGGIDSQVLLHALSNFKNNILNNPQNINQALSCSISVCHVNHGLSSNALKWENFAQQQCNLHQLPLDICRVNVKAKAQHSLEELARDARYDALKSLIKEKELKHVLVLTGHHNDDQAETFLLALKRGSGLKGLSAMKQEMVFGTSLLSRPLLGVSRSEIEAYAKEHQLTWIDDESNEDIRFDRNFLRHQVMPIITERWPSFLKTLNRSAEHCQEAELLLTELAEQDLENIQVGVNTLSLAKLQQLSQARFNNVIRYFLSIHQCLMPSTAQLTQLQTQLLANNDKSPAVKVGNYWLRRFKQCVYLTADFKDVSDFYSCVKPELTSTIDEVVKLPDGLGDLLFKYEVKNKNTEKQSDLIAKKNKTCQVIAPTYTQQVTIRFSHNNPTCIPDYRQHSRSLKKILQELDIPTWQRKRLPFVYYDDQLVAVIGYFVCKEFIPKEKDDTLQIIWNA